MQDCNCSKKTVRSEEEKKKINDRLSRIIGQLEGTKKMINEDRYCNDVLIQLSASSNAIKSLANHIIDNHIHSCIVRDIKDDKLESIDELIDLFRRFK